MSETQTWISPIISKRSKPDTTEIKNYAGDDRIVSSVEWDTEHQNEPDYLFSLKSRIPKLDQLCEGFRDGELYTISGFTKQGKTLLAQTLTASFVRQQYFPLWFTFEVPTKRFLKQFGPELPVFFIPRIHVAANFQWFLTKCHESFLKYKTRVIFIDHLHYMFNIAANKQNTSLDIGFIVRTLKTMAVQNNLLIFLLCHTKQTGEDKKESSYHDLRDSSFIAQESDSVFMMCRIEKTTQSKLFVEFHRRTGVMREMVPLLKKDNLLQENDQWREEPHWEKKVRNWQDTD